MTDKMLQAVGNFANRRQFLRRLTTGSAAIVAAGFNIPAKFIGAGDGTVMAGRQGGKLRGKFWTGRTQGGRAQVLVYPREIRVAGDALKAAGIETYAFGFTVDPARKKYHVIDVDLMGEGGTLVGTYRETLGSKDHSIQNMSMKWDGKNLGWTVQTSNNHYKLSVDGEARVSGILGVPNPLADQFVSEHKDLIILSGDIQSEVRSVVTSVILPHRLAEYQAGMTSQETQGSVDLMFVDDAGCPPVCNPNCDGQSHCGQSGIYVLRTDACQEAKDKANLDCWNALCTGCCRWDTVGNGQCDCGCVATDYLCSCTACGTSCGTQTCSPPPCYPNGSGCGLDCECCSGWCNTGSLCS